MLFQLILLVPYFNAFFLSVLFFFPIILFSLVTQFRIRTEPPDICCRIRKTCPVRNIIFSFPQMSYPEKMVMKKQVLTNAQYWENQNSGKSLDQGFFTPFLIRPIKLMTTNERRLEIFRSR